MQQGRKRKVNFSFLIIQKKINNKKIVQAFFR